MRRKLFIENDFRYLLYERWSRIRGKFSIWAARFWYGKRFHIQSHYSVWGSIRFLMHGAGRISIGKDFHAVSSRKRSFVTLFSPCQLTTIGPGVIESAEHVGLNGTTIVAREHVFLGKNVMVGPNSIIMDHDGHVPWPPEERWIKKGRVRRLSLRMMCGLA